MNAFDKLLSGETLAPTTILRNMVLFNTSASKELLKICRNKNVGLLGMEGFRLKNHQIEPQIDFIADFSPLACKSDFKIRSLDAAEKFLELAKNQEDLLFEYVLE